MITPQIHIENPLLGTKYEFYKTYRLLVKDIPRVMCEYGVKSIFVVRSRRGQWGEWFERWEMDYRCKPFIVKKGSS